MKSLIVAFVVIGSAFGQEPGRGFGRGPEGGFMRMSPILSGIDSNHDGVISPEEMRNAPAALRILDQNGDGQLTPEEVRPRFEGRGRGEGGGEAPVNNSEELVQTLMAFDKNHDGKISRDELPERMQGMLDRGDTNKDGFLTPDEIRKMATAQSGPSGSAEGEGRGEGRSEGRGGGRGMRMDPVFTALDTDHDGVISASEIAHAAESLKTLDRNGDGQLTEDEVRPNFGPGRGRGDRE